jgi:hypothetical protein
MGWPISHLEVCGALYTMTWSVFRNCDTYPPIWGGRVQAMKRSYGHHWLIHINTLSDYFIPLCKTKICPHVFQKKKCPHVSLTTKTRSGKKTKQAAGQSRLPVAFKRIAPCPAEMRDDQVLDARHGQRHDPSTDCYVQDIYPGDSCTTTRRP